MKKLRIFVTIGTLLPFDRLIKKIDEIAKEDLEIIAQIGKSKYIPKNIKNSVKYLTPKDMKKEMKRADVVIAHAGMGTIIDLIELKKKCILVPRLKKYKEAVDDHQLEICKELEKEGAIICYDQDKLNDKIKHAKLVRQGKSKEYEKLKKNIKRYINFCK
ncbi:MAG: PssE/Cps14G family polysaccharide biosynthesis glycosyltransferase [Candidatus Helarchaeota archaeon]